MNQLLINWRNLYIHISIWMLAATVTSCSNDTAETSALPGEIATFVSRYFPEIGVQAYSFNNGVYSVQLHNSALLQFNASMKWTDVDGRGNVLPEIFLFDEMPSPLYEYLETTDNLNGVYNVSRNNLIYTLTLTDSYLTYDIATGEVKN